MLYNSPSNKTNCLYVLSLLVALTTNKLIITKSNQKKNKNKQINKKINKIPKKKLKKYKSLQKDKYGKPKKLTLEQLETIRKNG